MIHLEHTMVVHLFLASPKLESRLFAKNQIFKTMDDLIKIFQKLKYEDNKQNQKFYQILEGSNNSVVEI